MGTPLPHHPHHYALVLPVLLPAPPVPPQAPTTWRSTCSVLTSSLCFTSSSCAACTCTACTAAGPNYLEIDLDVHNYAFIARKAFHGFIHRLAPVIFENAFLVQGEWAASA